jgi:flagellar motor protein MotB
MRLKVIFFLLLVIIIQTASVAQANHFIYLQSEGKQPFYAKIDKKVLSSSASGYLIIPKLTNRNYSITVGFPKGEIEEQIYTCNVNGKDAGYLIKNFGDKGWGLFNMQTLDVAMAGNTKNDIAKTPVNADEFSSMLSEAVNDPSIKQADKPASIGKDNISLEKSQSKGNIPGVARSTIIKAKTITTQVGSETTYIDVLGDKQDTIIIVFPVQPETNVDKTAANEFVQPDKLNETTNAIQEKKTTDVNQSIKKQNDGGIVRKANAEKKEEDEIDKKFLTVDVKPTVKSDTIPYSEDIIQMVNSDCRSYASEDDFLKFRKKMVSQDSEDAMISIAQKFFKAKCYSTEQVKNLSVLFLKDEGKYKFFDLSYAFVSDSHNFYTLESQLKDTYYIARFKAMVRR